MMLETLDVAIARAQARRRLPPPVRRRAIRERAGVSQGDIARALGVTVAAVARWEDGSRMTPRGETLQAYLDVLDRLQEATRCANP